MFSNIHIHPCQVGRLSLRHGASSDYVWSRPSVMEGSWKVLIIFVSVEIINYFF